MSKPTILLVQGRQTQGNGTKHSLELAGYRVIWAGNGASAMSAVTRETVDVIVIDVALPDIEGGDLCRLFRRRHSTSDVPIILLTVRDNTSLTLETPGDGPDDYVAKPYADAELSARIAAALKTKKLRKELVQKNLLLEETRAKAESAAIIDPATGLYNRAQFEAMFSKEFKRAVRYKQPVSCMRIVLDGRENGQKADEGLVKAIITLIQKTIREVDTAAWWTGEGFIVMIPNTPRDNALQAAARVLFAVAEHPFTWSDSNKVALNIGVAGLPDDKIDTEEKLVKAADEALRQARRFLLLPPVIIPRKRSSVVQKPKTPEKIGAR
jgi:diguanylate cyclase (GGDEF)-like protein